MRKFFSKLIRSVRPAVSSVLASQVASPIASSEVVSAAPAVLASAEAVENLEGRRLFSSSLAYGINANAISSSTYPNIVKMMHDTGTKSARLWLSTNYSKTETGIFKYVRKFKNEGFDVMVTVEGKGGASAGTIESYYSWLADDLGGSVDRFQVGNEVDRTFGTSDSGLGRYVDNVLKPASEGLRSQGEKVVSGSVSWNPDDIATLVDQGMLKYVDFVGYHPYRPSISALKSAVAEVKGLVGGKPLVASEWNARGHEGNMGEWNDAIKESWPTIRDNFYAAYYFAAVKVGTLAGPAGVITSGGGANGEFYSTYKGLRGNNSGDGDVTPTQPTQPSTPTQPTAPTVPSTPVTNGNTPSTTGRPSVGGFRIFDGITGQVIKGYENVTSGQTIKLTDLAHRQIQIRALTSSNAQSVKFSFSGRATRTENTAPYTVFGNSKNVETPWYTSKGKYALTATAYSADNAKGAASTSLSLILNFI